MKTITVTDEQYDFLINLSKELHSQDSRATADPIFCAYELERFYTEDGAHECYVSSDGEVDDDFIKESIVQYREDNVGCLLDDEEIIEELNYRKVHYDIREVPVSGQYYFSEKAAQGHINQNSYHYHKPFTYAESAWRNYEWQTIREIIMNLMKT